MFKFNEDTVFEIFTNKLDELLPGAILMRPHRSKKTLPDQLGLEVIITDRLKRQPNKDPIKLVMYQAATALATGVARLYGSTSCNFSIGTLRFEYEEGEFETSKDKLESGTSITIVIPIKEGGNTNV